MLQTLIHVNVTLFPRTEQEDTGQRTLVLWETLTFGREGGISSQHYMKIYNQEGFIIKGSRKNSLKG